MNFYTYVHFEKDTKKPFYVGKGKNKRAWCKKGRNNFWHNIVKKHGYEVEIMSRWADETQAFEHEKFLISTFEVMGFRLANLTIGGEGISGYKATKEQIKNNIQAQNRPEIIFIKSKAAKALYANKQWSNVNRNAKIKALENPEVRKKMSESAKVKIFTEQHRKNMSLSRIGNVNSKKPHVLSEEVKEKYRKICIERNKANAGKPSFKRKKVRLIELDKVFEHASSAMDWLRKNGKTTSLKTGNICNVCNKKAKSSFGYNWEYA